MSISKKRSCSLSLRAHVVERSWLWSGPISRSDNPEPVWRIPMTKAGRAHTLTLAPPVVALLQSVPRLNGSPVRLPKPSRLWAPREYFEGLEAHSGTSRTSGCAHS